MKIKEAHVEKDRISEFDKPEAEYVKNLAGYESTVVNGFEITIEPLNYGDFYVGVYKDGRLVLNRKYYTNDHLAAHLIHSKLAHEYMPRV